VQSWQRERSRLPECGSLAAKSARLSARHPTLENQNRGHGWDCRNSVIPSALPTEVRRVRAITAVQSGLNSRRTDWPRRKIAGRYACRCSGRHGSCYECHQAGGIGYLAAILSDLNSQVRRMRNPQKGRSHEIRTNIWFFSIRSVRSRSEAPQRRCTVELCRKFRSTITPIAWLGSSRPSKPQARR